MNISEEDLDHWVKYKDAYLKLTHSLQTLLSPRVDYVKLLKRGFRDGDLAPFIYLVDLLDIEGVKQVIDELVILSTHDGYALKSRSIIGKIPINWLSKNLEIYVKPLIEEESELVFRRILELYFYLGTKELFNNLLIVVKKHPDSEIRDIAKDFDS
ncbi:MAG: hypothetical protein QNJ45_03340 [Ardenticatenaceae bacterium]|nr:hypothetical protein [Ardenticatenaceae bacterium]